MTHNGSDIILNPSANVNGGTDGSVIVNGKVNASGGVDPPYVLYDLHTRSEIKGEVAVEVPKEKQTGAVLFYCADAGGAPEWYLPSKNEFRDMAWKLVASTNVTAKPFTNMVMHAISEARKKHQSSVVLPDGRTMILEPQKKH